MIRDARFGDIPRLVELMEQAYRGSRYAELGSIDVPVAKALWLELINHQSEIPKLGGTLVLVSERDGEVEGFFSAHCERVYLVGDRLCAADVFIYQTHDADPRDFMRAIKRFIAWGSASPDVVEFSLAATDAFCREHGLAGIVKLYESAGFEQSGVIYRRAA